MNASRIENAAKCSPDDSSEHLQTHSRKHSIRLKPVNVATIIPRHRSIFLVYDLRKLIENMGIPLMNLLFIPSHSGNDPDRFANLRFLQREEPRLSAQTRRDASNLSRRANREVSHLFASPATWSQGWVHVRWSRSLAGGWKARGKDIKKGYEGW